MREFWVITSLPHSPRLTVTAIGPGGEVIDSGKTRAELGLVSIGGQCD